MYFWHKITKWVDIPLKSINTNKINILKFINYTFLFLQSTLKNTELIINNKKFQTFNLVISKKQQHLLANLTSYKTSCVPQ